MESIATETTTEAIQTGLALLTPDELEKRLMSSRSHEQTALAQFLVHLGEVDRRSTYRLTSGMTTLWGYVHEKLGFPECQTFLRTSAARVVAAYPEVTEYIVDGRLNLSAVSMLKNTVLPHGQGKLAPQAARKIFDSSSRLSTRALKRFLAGLRAPTKRAPDGFRPALPPTATIVAASDLALRPDADQLVSAVVGEDGKTTYVAIQPGNVVLLTGIEMENKIVPIADGQKEFVATIVGDSFENDLAELAFLSPTLDPNDYLGLIHSAVKRTIRLLKKKKGLDPNEPILARQAEARAAAAAGEPAAQPATSNADPNDKPVTNAALAEIAARLGRVHIPIALQAEILRRAQYCCEGIGDDGRRCCSTRRCQFDHKNPICKGGKTDSANLQILCERCNLIAARRILGDAVVDECIARNAAKRSTKEPLRAHEVN